MMITNITTLHCILVINVKLSQNQLIIKDLQKKFLDKADLSGSILEQIDTILKTTEIYNKTKATFPNQTYRLEVRDYPTQALREAILNAFCHRDYSLINSDITISFLMIEQKFIHQVAQQRI